MTVRLIGGAMIMLAAVLYGRMKIAEERQKIELVDAAEELVRAVRDNIAHYKKPLGEIYESVSVKALEDNGFLPLCRTDGIRTAWEKTPMKLPPKITEVMKGFVSQIGSGYRDDELELCAYTLEQLDKTAAAERTERLNREKLYRNIPPLVALSVVLLVI